MIALVLVHEGLDVSIDLELREPGPGGDGPVGHRGGDRLVVTARADRAALEWALRLADRVVVLTVGPPEVGGRARVGARPGRWSGGQDLGRRARACSTSGRWRESSPPPSGGSPRTSSVAGERGLAGATGALPALVAAHLGWPSVDGAIRLAREEDELVVERRLPGGRREELAVPCPGVVTVAADSVEPRYVSVRRPARRGAARPRDLVAGGPRSHGERRARGGEGPGGPGGLAAAAAPPDGRGGPGGPARSAADRLRQLVGGGRAGAGPERSGRTPPASGLVEGDPRAVADRIMAFLEQRGFV